MAVKERSAAMEERLEKQNSQLWLWLWLGLGLLILIVSAGLMVGPDGEAVDVASTPDVAPTPDVVPAPVQGDPFTNSIGMKLVFIPPGQFMMGSSLSAAETVRRFGGEIKLFQNEHPRHRVRFTKGFHMAATEVTRGHFARFVAATGYRTQAETSNGALKLTGKRWKMDANTNWRNPGFAQTDDHPVVCMTWNDATAFCRWLGLQENAEYRLPTESEWEYACRAGGRSIFPWGDSNDAGKGWANAADLALKRKFGPSPVPLFNWDDGHVFTAPVGSYQSNAWALHDMIGNVWEWCSDRYGDYPEGNVTDPIGPAIGRYRNLRGGSWDSGPRRCRSASRGSFEPGNHRDGNYGFRVVCSVPPGLAR